MLLVAKCRMSSLGCCCLSVYPQAYFIIKHKLVICSEPSSLANANKPLLPSHSLLYLNLVKSISVETGNTLSSEQSPLSIANQELHKKCHFCPVCKSCTTTVPTNLQKRWQKRTKSMFRKLRAQQERMSQEMSPLWGVASPWTQTLDPWHKEILYEGNNIINWIWVYWFK